MGRKPLDIGAHHLSVLGSFTSAQSGRHTLWIVFVRGAQVSSNKLLMNGYHRVIQNV